MPTKEENLDAFGEKWDSSGDEWSGEWGDAETHWHATLLPRIRRFIPARRILEIAPGHGRWSQFLIAQADEYVGVDLAQACVDACRSRFQGAANARFETNDGASLAAVEDNSIDFAFSFDSLVHVEIEIIKAYLRELGAKLAPEGVAFLHHSNAGALAGSLSFRLTRASRGKELLYKVLERARLIGWDNWRALSVTSQAVASAAREANLVCVGQEIINWGRPGRKPLDCMSVFARPGSRWDRPNVVVRNLHFMAEAFSAKAISQVYTTLPSTKGGSE